MGGESWSLTGKPCDSCKAIPATVFCRADSAYLCTGCDAEIHAANKLASRHARVWVCEVCEHAPASVTCRADSAALCATCDHDIHTANLLASRHERIPIIPFFDSASASSEIAAAAVENDGSSNQGVLDVAEEEEAEAEAGSWLLLGPNCNKEVDSDGPEEEEDRTIEYLFNDVNPYLDMGLISEDQKPNVVDHFHHHDNDRCDSRSSDGVVPVQNKNDEHNHFYGGLVAGYPAYDMDYGAGSTKPFMYNFNYQSVSQSVSSSSMEVGVVPDHNPVAVDAITRNGALPNPVSGLDREARVLRYREKRKNRKFEKTVRYASRKAYAETRPRIKGRFAKRSEVEVDSLVSSDVSYGIVPTY